MKLKAFSPRHPSLVARGARSAVIALAAQVAILTASSPVLAAGPAVGGILTIAGTGTGGFNGDLSQATASQIYDPQGTAVDAAGNVYIADTNNHRIRKITAATGVISTVAGTGTAGFLGDGGLATAARIYYPTGVAVDQVGNVYIADRYNYRVRKVAAGTGIITTVAGSGTAGFGGDGGLATAASLNQPHAVAVDSSNNLYIADTYTHRVRVVAAATGVIATLAGTGAAGYNGDGLATGVNLYYPSGVAVDYAGTV
jgi:sugar lactone lactonase YvrE